LGNLSIEPNFIYLLGTRKFCRAGGPNIPGAVSNTIGTAGVIPAAGTPCTSANAGAGGVNDIDFNAFQTELVLHYTLGKWLLSGKGAYASGDDATDDLNNQGLTRGRTRDDVNGFRPLGIDAFNRIGEWLSILGRGEVFTSRTAQSPFRAGEVGGLDRFGLVTGAGKVEYKLTDRLTLVGVAGTAFTAETTACPAVQRTAAVSAANPTGCASTPLNFTGNSKYMGTEVDALLRWTIMPGLVNIIGGGYAFLGDAFQIQNRNVQDAWLIANRLLFSF
ncbi:MAG: hypothetical protein HYZ81_06080, partial [Nitrospinae bacterium]|nr:hypothetical protein [Nitrospinota bacterium]